MNVKSDHKELLGDFYRLCDGYTRLHHIDINDRKRFEEAFKAEVFDKCMGKEAHITAVNMWTSPKPRFCWEGNQEGIELCSIINEIVRHVRC